LGGFEQPVWERYEVDEAYRDSIQELLETGAGTREQLIALAKESEFSREDVYTPEEEAILKTLYPRPYGCPAGVMPLKLPLPEDSARGNDRPPI